MPIVFSAIVPHPPILIPTIGKENINQLKATSDSYLKLEQDLYASQAETIIIISPHGHSQEQAFTINLSPEFKGNFEKFGDLTTKFSLSGDIELAHQIKEKLETKIPLQLISETELDHGSSVPIYILTKHLPKIKIIPLYYSGLTLAAHYDFGQMIKSKLLNSSARIAIIASGDLSHKLSKNAPAGYSPKGKKFDKKLIDNLLKKETGEIIKFKPELIADAGECGLKSIMILLGVLESMKYEPQLLSYESPFGVGYLTMNFKL
ncbi:AmmeMemoRadiSam system protein B [Patescibacteria group bacterium]|nr:AmmeMemoRadiSam system protein B [Patescibacteria group bacterium]MBU1663153.1 AmmeMemoRadiSam system protein B [Patescibacteria group bacterium]MBU1934085.1 AmmeMemoRadiSam system protein B [Patescibacteria group bacterium]MBU2008102.1 AmmeMemoRadiSam system protein B [Patescibacteria group bacterium]MBU2233403.1 AmmeMemoRadiSam system protein B [Patescibacteria group bacterium]